MADPRFFKKSSNFNVRDIIGGYDYRLSDDSGATRVLEDVAPLKDAGIKHLSFFDNIKYKSDFQNTRAGACFCNAEMVQHAPEGLICIVADNPYKAYALAAQKFYPEVHPATLIHPSAVVSDTAKIGEGVRIDANAVIGDNVEIGEYSWIGANATISHAIIGSYSRLYPGVRVGQDGFGFAIDPTGFVKVPQLGRVIIQDHVEIGANTTIDRGAGPDTIIGQGTWIDNLVQIGHNVQIGKGCVIVAQVGISGSTKLEDFVMIGGQAGLAGHLRISSGVRIGAQAGIMSDLDTPGEYMGSPAFPKRQFFKQIAALNRLIKGQKKD